MTEQDTTLQDKTTPTQDNQNTPDNNTPDQTTTQHNAPHYITKSPQHNTKNLPLQVLVDETSGKTRLDPKWGVMTADEYREINGVKAPETSGNTPVSGWLDGLRGFVMGRDMGVGEPLTRESLDMAIEAMKREII